MKRIFLVSLLIFLFTFCKGQDLSHVAFSGQKAKSSYPIDSANNRYYISIDAGIGIPVSDGVFQRYANVGPFINVYSNIPIHQRLFGFAGMIGYGSNQIDINSYARDQRVITTSTSEGNYNVLTAMSGLYVLTPLDAGAIDFHFLVGGVYFSTPEMVYSGDRPNYSAWYADDVGTWVIPAANNLSLAFDLGASLKYLVSKRFFWLLNMDVLHSGLNGGFILNAQFTRTGCGCGTNYGNIQPSSSGGAGYPSMTLLNFTTGLGYRF